MSLPSDSQDRPHYEETQRLKQEVDELSALFEITKRLRRPFELPVLLDEILEVCRDLTKAEAASLLLLDESKQQLNFALVKGGPEEILKNLPPMPTGEGVAGWVAQSGESVIVNDVKTDRRFSRRIDTSTRFKTRSILAAPMRTEEEILGVLEVLNKRDGEAFTPADQRLFEIFAEQAAVAYQAVRDQLKRRDADRMATIGRMASAIIHDLKNPMTAIKGFAELIKEKAPDTERFADIIIREIDRLVEMTRELLEFSRGEPHLDLQPTDIRAFVVELAEVLAPDFEAADVALDLDIGWDGQLPLDANKLRRVFYNLAGNARDAMPDGGSFKISVSRTGDGVSLAVTDSGVGMDEQTCRSCFETFFTQGKKKGTGLGLAIVRTIVRAHQGRIEASSVPGQGTTFTIWLPLQHLPAAD